MTHTQPHIILGDVVKTLETLKDRKYSVIFADPPSVGDVHVIINSLWTKKMTLQTRWLDWCHDWIKSCLQMLEPGGVLYVNALYDQGVALSELRPHNRLLPWQFNVWNKNISKNKPGWSKTKRGRENAPASVVCFWNLGTEPVFNDVEFNIGWPGSGFICSDCNSGFLHGDDDRQHTRCWNKIYSWAQKDPELTRRLLLNHPEATSALVLFSGSGSECLACRDQGIQYTGIEIDEDQNYLSRVRLEQEHEPVPHPVREYKVTVLV